MATENEVGGIEIGLELIERGDVAGRLDVVAKSADAAEAALAKLGGTHRDLASKSERAGSLAERSAARTTAAADAYIRQANAAAGLTRGLTASTAAVEASHAATVRAMGSFGEYVVRERAIIAASEGLAAADSKAARERAALNATLAKTPTPPAPTAPTAPSELADGGLAKASEQERTLQAARAQRAQQERELVASADRLAAGASKVQAGSPAAVAAYTREAVAIRDKAAAMRALHLVEEPLQRGGAAITANQRAATLAAAELDAYAEATRRAGVATAATTATTTAASTAAAASAGRFAAMRSAVLGVASGVAGAIPGLGSFATLLGGLAAGAGLTIAVTAGIGAIMAAWDRLTASARKAKEEHQAALKTLADFRKQQEQGPAGDLGAKLPTGRAEAEKQLQLVRDLEKRVTSLRGAASSEGEQAELARLEKRLDATRRHYRELAGDVAVSERGVNKLVTDASTQARQHQEADLAARLQFNQKDAGARKTALAMLAEDRREYARLLRLPDTPDNSAKVAEYAQSIKQLDDALKGPKAKRDPDTANLAGDLRAREQIAATEERRTEAARALAAAAERGQAFYDREVRSQALKNELLETEGRIRASFRDTKDRQRPGTEREMEAEIARAQAAIRERDALAQGTAASLDIGKAEQENAVLRAKAESYDIIGRSAKESADQVEYSRRMTEASAVTDETKRRKLQELAAEWLKLRSVVAQKDESAEAAKKTADEAARVVEQRWRQVQRVLSSTINQFFTDLSAGKNVFQSLWDSAKAGFFRMYADIAAAKLTDKFKEMMGDGPTVAAKKNEQAGDTMNEASMRFMDAARLMAGLPPIFGSASTVGSVMETPAASSMLDTLEARLPQWMGKTMGAVRQAAAPAIAGFGVGYGAGQSLYSPTAGGFGNSVRGALGGAVSGAAAGAAFGPWGAAVGALAGLTGGLLGMGKAAREAAEQMTAATEAVVLSQRAFRADVHGETLDAALANAETRFKEAAEAIEAAWPGGGRDSDRVAWRTKQHEDLNRTQAAYVRMLQEENALKLARSAEDFDVRRLRAEAELAGKEGRTADATRLGKDADDRAFENDRRREREEFRKTLGEVIGDNPGEQEAWNAFDEMDASLRRNHAATDKNTEALNALTTSVRGAPAGFSVEHYIRQVVDPVRDYGSPASALPPARAVPPDALPRDTRPSVPLDAPNLAAQRLGDQREGLLRDLARDPMADLARELATRQQQSALDTPTLTERPAIGTPGLVPSVSIQVTVSPGSVVVQGAANAEQVAQRVSQQIGQQIAQQVEQQLRLHLTPSRVAQLNIQGLERRGSIRKGINTSLSATLNRG